MFAFGDSHHAFVLSLKQNLKKNFSSNQSFEVVTDVDSSVDSSVCSSGKRSAMEGPTIARKLNTASFRRRMMQFYGEGYKHQTDDDILDLMQETLGIKLCANGEWGCVTKVTVNSNSSVSDLSQNSTVSHVDSVNITRENEANKEEAKVVEDTSCEDSLRESMVNNDKENDSPILSEDSSASSCDSMDSSASSSVESIKEVDQSRSNKEVSCQEETENLDKLELNLDSVEHHSLESVAHGPVIDKEGKNQVMPLTT